MIKKLVLALSFLLMPATVHGLTEPDRQELQIKNILAPYNAGFENGKAKWTASGGSFNANTTAAHVGSGRTSASFDASSSGQNLDSTAVTIPAGLYGRNGLAVCNFKTSATDYKIQAHDGTNVIAESVIASGSTFSTTAVTFTFPSSGSMKIRVTSQSNADILYVDDCYIGENYQVGTVGQATLYGSVFVPGTANCSWGGITGTSFTDFAADTDCPSYTVSGNAQQPATKIPGATFANYPPGDYLIVVMGSLAKTSNAGGYVHFRISDGTNTSNIVTVETLSGSVHNSTGGAFRLTNNTARSNVTLQVQAAADGSATVGLGYNNVAGKTDFAMYVYRYPLASEQAYRPDQTPAIWTGYHGSDCHWSTTSASYVDPSGDASCTFTQQFNQNMGTVSSAGSKLPGIVFTPPRAGLYEVCAAFSGYGDTTGVNRQFRLYDGTNELDEGVGSEAFTNNWIPFRLCGKYNATSIAQATIKIQPKSNGTAVINLGNSTTLTSSIRWSIVQLDVATPMPVLVGSITSNSSGQERIERAIINCGSSGSGITSQSGTWISSVSNGGATGRCVVNFVSGMFKSTPSCFCTSNRVDSQSDVTCHYITSSASTSSIEFARRNSGAENGELHIMCIGPR